MAKVTIDIPEDVHFKLKKLQIERAEKGEKINLRELYIEVLRVGISQIKP